MCESTTLSFKDKNYSIKRMSLIRRANRSDCKESCISTGLLQASFTELQDFLFSPVNVLNFQRNKAATMLFFRSTFSLVCQLMYAVCWYNGEREFLSGFFLLGEGRGEWVHIGLLDS